MPFTPLSLSFSFAYRSFRYILAPIIHFFLRLSLLLFLRLRLYFLYSFHYYIFAYYGCERWVTRLLRLVPISYGAITNGPFVHENTWSGEIITNISHLACAIFVSAGILTVELIFSKRWHICRKHSYRPKADLTTDISQLYFRFEFFTIVSSLSRKGDF